MKLLTSFLLLNLITITALAAGNDKDVADKKEQIIQTPSTQYKINFLPDGTEVKMVGKKIYYVCKHKLKPFPDGLYMLADGTVIKIRDSYIVRDNQKRQRPNTNKLSQKAPSESKEKLNPLKPSS